VYLAYLLQFAVASACSHFYEAGFVALHYEAAAFRKVKNFAEPPQTFYVTPAVADSKSLSYLNVDIREKIFQTKMQFFQQKLT